MHRAAVDVLSLDMSRSRLDRNRQHFQAKPLLARRRLLRFGGWFGRIYLAVIARSSCDEAIHLSAGTKNGLLRREGLLAMTSAFKPPPAHPSASCRRKSGKTALRRRGSRARWPGAFRVR